MSIAIAAIICIPHSLFDICISLLITNLSVSALQLFDTVGCVTSN